ncbi:MAG: hypothetical protein R2780_09850 [Crocinitomicaceae bacterium]|nr:hypothetical protein [Crocinitomicaceae bacterium]
MLLTHMPSFSEFMTLVAIICAMISAGLGLLITLIVAIVKKEQWKVIRYIKLFFQIFIFGTIGLTLLVALLLFLVGS